MSTRSVSKSPFFSISLRDFGSVPPSAFSQTLLRPFCFLSFRFSHNRTFVLFCAGLAGHFTTIFSIFSLYDPLYIFYYTLYKIFCQVLNTEFFVFVCIFLRSTYHLCANCFRKRNIFCPFCFLGIWRGNPPRCTLPRHFPRGYHDF